MDYYCYGDVYYYMDDHRRVQATFLTPDSMCGDSLLFDTEEECLAYWMEEWGLSDEMESAA